MKHPLFLRKTGWFFNGFSIVFIISFLTMFVAANEKKENSNDWKIVSPTVELLDSPQGIDVLQPTFCWKLISDQQGEQQSAYQIIVKSANDGSVVWDSGKVVSDQQTFIQYSGDALKPGTKFEFSISVWNQDGSKVAKVNSTFSTGLYATEADQNPWKGKWIGYQEKIQKSLTVDIQKASWIAFEKNFSIAPGYSVYRKTFDISDVSQLKQAFANFTGDNHYRVFLNGQEIGNGSNYMIAPSLNILESLQNGKNVFAIEVNNFGDSSNPGGLIGGFSFISEEETIDFFTGADWKAIQGTDDAYFAIDFDDSAWNAASVLAPCGEGPWGEVQATQPNQPSIPARYLAKNFDIPSDKEIKRATIYIAGLGYYEVFLAGEKVGDHVLDPVLTDYDVRVSYNTYDVTEMLNDSLKKSNENQNNPGYRIPSGLIGVVLGNGRYYAPRQSEPMTTKTYGVPRLLFQWEIEYADGSKDIFVSDESWKISVDGPIRENNDYDGEIIDARYFGLPLDQAGRPIRPIRETGNDSESPRKRMKNFSAFIQKGKETSNGFMNGVIVRTNENAQILEAPKGKLVAQMMPPMRVTEEIKPISVKEVKPGVWVYDFGQNFVGWARLKVKGDRGTKILLRFAETLQTEGKDAGMLYTANLRQAKCRDIFILNGGKVRNRQQEFEIYQPRFTYHGFRYAELTGYQGTPDLETLTGCVVGTDLPIVGSFQCSDPTITQFYKNIEWGTRGNYLSIPTDCPQRDERQGWQGDRAAESKGEMFIFDNITLYRKWMQDIEDSQLENGNVSDVCPAYWPLYGSNVTWPSAQIIIPESLYLMYGDKASIAKHYDSRKKWLNHMATFIKEDGTIDKDNYTDWCVPPEKKELIHSQDPMRQTARGILATAYYAYDLKLSATFADMLGKTEDAKEFRDRAAKATEALNAVYYNAEEGKYDNGTQTSCVLPLYFGLVPKGEEDKVFETLINNIENVTNKHIGTGLIGGQWLNRLLSDRGRIDLSYIFATNRTYPSWGYMLEKGATTVWELWNGDTADPAMNSGNHVMLVGDLGIWYYEYLAGIKADDQNPGFKHILMKPFVVGDLTWVDASYDSIRGKISSKWRYNPQNSSFEWNIEIPANSTATVFVPTSNADSVVVDGLDLTAVKKTATDDRLEFELGSGIWTIKSELKK
ncbi:MAG: family 78 glycoside hydrolase catalytic domain [Planctomycetia bacterium]|nr:family 78 glycoside hydrolase catalytic domain [Planctomycetia bacterium]